MYPAKATYFLILHFFLQRLPTEGEGHCANILQPNDVTRGKDMCYERESKHCLTGPPLNLVVPHIPPPGQPDQVS